MKIEAGEVLGFLSERGKVEWELALQKALNARVSEENARLQAENRRLSEQVRAAPMPDISGPEDN